MNRSTATLLTDSVRHRLPTFAAVALGVAGSVLFLTLSAPASYDATAIVGFTPEATDPVASDVVRLSAAQAAESATSTRALAAAERDAGVTAGSLSPDQITAALVPDTGLVELVVSGGDAQTSADLVNGLASELVTAAPADLLRAEVVRQAQPPASPAGPPSALWIAAALIAGLTCALGVVMGVEAWRPRIRNAHHLSLILGVPTVADLRFDDSDEPPAQQMNAAQLRLSGPPLVGGRHRELHHHGGVAVVGGGRTSLSCLEWVGRGLTAAFEDSGHDATLLRLGSEKTPSVRTDFDSPIYVLPTTYQRSSAQGLTNLHSMQRAVVVVAAHEAAEPITRLRLDLEAVGVALVAGVLIHQQRASGGPSQSNRRR